MQESHSPFDAFATQKAKTLRFTARRKGAHLRRARTRRTQLSKA